MEDLRKGQDGGPEPQGRDPEPDQGGAVQPRHGDQGRPLAALRADGDREDVGGPGRDGHHRHDPQEGGIAGGIDGKDHEASSLSGGRRRLR